MNRVINNRFIVFGLKLTMYTYTRTDPQNGMMYEGQVDTKTGKAVAYPEGGQQGGRTEAGTEGEVPEWLVFHTYITYELIVGGTAGCSYYQQAVNKLILKTYLEIIVYNIFIFSIFLIEVDGGTIHYQQADQQFIHRLV